MTPDEFEKTIKKTIETYIKKHKKEYPDTTEADAEYWIDGFEFHLSEHGFDE